ncbi:MAG TPA: hypothetical protein VFG14_12215, partial [Chthoniobacteraceae bacterium]|nr:hypothetical protein [Chthoniobacteraceae bacterium]
RELLLRVPGLGVRNVDRIILIRRWKRIALADLTRLRVSITKVRPFVVVADYRPQTIGSSAWRQLVQPPEQLNLFNPPA